MLLVDRHFPVARGERRRAGPRLGRHQPSKSAIESASNGDTVLVKTSGNYAEILVDAKALTVMADAGVQVTCEATVRNLTASQRVCLRGLDFYPYGLFSDSEPGLSVVNDQGMVWVEDCDVPAIGVYSTAPGILVDRCASVVLMRTRSHGGEDAAQFGNDYRQNG